MEEFLAVLILVLGVPLGMLIAVWMIKTRVKIPMVIRIKAIVQEELDPITAGLLREYDSQLEKLEFEPVGDFEVEGIEAENKHRVYLNSNKDTLALVSLAQIGFRKKAQLEFYTRFQDNSSLSTDQGLLPNFLEIPPERELKRFPGISNPEKLFNLHLKRLEQLNRQGKSPALFRKETIIKDLEKNQQELLEFQIKKDLLIPAPEEGILKPSFRFAFYFIFKIFDPIPLGINGKKFILCLAGFAILIFGLFFSLRFGENFISFDSALSKTQILYLLATIGSGAAGIILGYLIQQKGLLWAGVISLSGIFIIKDLFPNPWLIILISAWAGLVGNRIFEARLTKSLTRLFGPLAILIALIVMGYYMLNNPI